jgi:hypothetical protein
VGDSKLVHDTLRVSPDDCSVAEDTFKVRVALAKLSLMIMIMSRYRKKSATVYAMLPPVCSASLNCCQFSTQIARKTTSSYEK